MLADAPGGKPEVILIASGSEVSLAIEAHEQLLSAGVRSRVVSMPSWDVFEQQSLDYRDSSLLFIHGLLGENRSGSCRTRSTA